MRTVYVNAAYLPENEAKISIFDRGFLFADAVYEVTAVIGGKLVDYARHVERLRRSLAEVGMTLPVNDGELLAIHRTLIQRNDLAEGLVYLQVTRGAADRDFPFPGDIEPGLVLFTQRRRIGASPCPALRIVTMPDLRWQRCDIKTVQLLYPAMAKTAARRRGADDAWLVRDGTVTEGSSSNAFIVTTDGRIVTRDPGPAILSGVTRQSVLACARTMQIRVEERPFTPDEVHAAAEAFISSTSNTVCAVVALDGRRLGHGEPGPVTLRLRDACLKEARRGAI